jgi:hypothetical protein
VDTLIVRLPLWVRKFIVDFAETGLAALLTLQLVAPASTDEVRIVATTVAAALAGALISAARRAAPDAVAWLAAKLGTTGA